MAANRKEGEEDVVPPAEDRLGEEVGRFFLGKEVGRLVLCFSLLTNSPLSLSSIVSVRLNRLNGQ